MALYCLQYYSELQFYNSIFKLRINKKTTTANTKLNFQQKLLSYKCIVKLYMSYPLEYTSHIIMVIMVNHGQLKLIFAKALGTTSC